MSAAVKSTELALKIMKLIDETEDDDSMKMVACGIANKAYELAMIRNSIVANITKGLSKL